MLDSAPLETLITGSSLLLLAISFWIFCRALAPVFRGIEKRLEQSIGAYQQVKFKAQARTQLQNFAQQLRATARRQTIEILRWADRFWLFNKPRYQANHLANKKYQSKSWLNLYQLKHLQYWSSRVWILSWLISLFYLALMLFVVYYHNLPKEILWQLVFLLLLYGAYWYFSWQRLLPYYQAALKRKNTRSKNTKPKTQIISFLALAGTFVLALADTGALSQVWAWASALSETLSQALSEASALALALALAGILAGTLVGAGAQTWAQIWAWALAGIWVAMIYFEHNSTGTFIMKWLSDPGLTEKHLPMFLVFFVIMPILNGLLDSLSVSVSRYEFGRLLQNHYKLRRFLRISLWDFFLAVVFKLLVLAMLYGSALLLENTGGTFKIFEIENYWNHLLAATVGAGWNFLFSDPTHTMITLMISTTLLPTIVHFLWVAYGTIIYFLAESISLLRSLFFSSLTPIASLLSLLLVLGFLGIFALAKMLIG